MAFATRISGAAALGAALLIGTGLLAPPAQAGYVITLQQVGSDVVASGSGTIDLTGLTIYGAGTLAPANLAAADGYVNTGVTGAGIDAYSGFTGPTSYGSGGFVSASSSSGDAVGIAASSGLYGVPIFWVPSGYVSGSSLSDTATYTGETFASLGVTPGTYVWTWGSSPNTDSFTIDVEAAAAPEPSGLALLALPLGIAMLLATRRRQA